MFNFIINRFTHRSIKPVPMIHHEASFLIRQIQRVTSEQKRILRLQTLDFRQQSIIIIHHLKTFRLLPLLHQIQGVTIHQIRRTLTTGITCRQLIGCIIRIQRLIQLSQKLVRIHRTFQLGPHLFIRVYHNKRRIGCNLKTLGKLSSLFLRIQLQTNEFRIKIIPHLLLREYILCHHLARPTPIRVKINKHHFPLLLGSYNSLLP